MRRAEDYRQRALEHRLMSTHASSPDLRQHYRDLAEMLDRMADEWLTLEVLPGPDLTNVPVHHHLG